MQEGAELPAWGVVVFICALERNRKQSENNILFLWVTALFSLSPFTL